MLLLPKISSPSYALCLWCSLISCVVPSFSEDYRTSLIYYMEKSPVLGRKRWFSIHRVWWVSIVILGKEVSYWQYQGLEPFTFPGWGTSSIIRVFLPQLYCPWPTPFTYWLSVLSILKAQHHMWVLLRVVRMQNSACIGTPTPPNWHPSIKVLWFKSLK